MKITKSSPRKLLVAAVGVATISYVAIACDKPPVSGNLPAPKPVESSPPPTSGNLPGPRPIDAGIPPTSGNLPAPKPVDAGTK